MIKVVAGAPSAYLWWAKYPILVSGGCRRCDPAVCIRGYKCKRPVDDTVATQKKCNRISTILDNLAMTMNQKVYGRASERIRSFLVTSQHLHRTFLPRHGRIPLGRVPRARQLDLTIRRRRKDDVMSGQRVCVPPRGRVEVDEGKRKEVHQKSQTLTRRKGAMSLQPGGQRSERRHTCTSRERT